MIVLLLLLALSFLSSSIYAGFTFPDRFFSVTFLRQCCIMVNICKQSRTLERKQVGGLFCVTDVLCQPKFSIAFPDLIFNDNKMTFRLDSKLRRLRTKNLKATI